MTILEQLGKRVRCRCDQCGNVITKYLSQLTNMTYQFCSLTCSTNAKKIGGVIDVQVKERSRSFRGVEHHLVSHEVKLKREETNTRLYGVANQFQRSVIINKIASIAKNKTTKEREAIRKKSKQTCLERYGVEHASQSLDVHERQMANSRSAHERGHIVTQWGTFWYRSSWELQFLNWCVTNATHVQANVYIPYTYDGEKHVYFADFFVTVNGLNFLCEVKPDALASLLRNQVKFEAGRRWCKDHQAEFVVVNKTALSDLHAALLTRSRT